MEKLTQKMSEASKKLEKVQQEPDPAGYNTDLGVVADFGMKGEGIFVEDTEKEEAKLGEAREAIGEKDYGKAISILDGVLANNWANNSGAYSLYSEALRGLSEDKDEEEKTRLLNRALEVNTQAIRINPANMHAKIQRGAILHALDKDKEASQAIESLLRDKKALADNEFLALAGEISESQGDHETAIRLYKKLKKNAKSPNEKKDASLTLSSTYKEFDKAVKKRNKAEEEKKKKETWKDKTSNTLLALSGGAKEGGGFIHPVQKTVDKTLRYSFFGLIGIAVAVPLIFMGFIGLGIGAAVGIGWGIFSGMYLYVTMPRHANSIVNKAIRKSREKDLESKALKELKDARDTMKRASREEGIDPETKADLLLEEARLTADVARADKESRESSVEYLQAMLDSDKTAEAFAASPDKKAQVVRILAGLNTEDKRGKDATDNLRRAKAAAPGEKVNLALDLADIYMDDGNPEKALKELDKVRDKKNPNPEILKRIVKARRALKRPSVGTLKIALKADEDNAEIIKLLMSEYVREGKLDAATALVVGKVLRFPENEEIRALLDEVKKSTLTAARKGKSVKSAINELARAIKGSTDKALVQEVVGIMEALSKVKSVDKSFLYRVLFSGIVAARGLNSYQKFDMLNDLSGKIKDRKGIIKEEDYNALTLGYNEVLKGTSDARIMAALERGLAIAAHKLLTSAGQSTGIMHMQNASRHMEEAGVSATHRVEAKELEAEILRPEPDTVIGRDLENAGEYGRAKERYANALETRPDDWEAHLGLGRIAAKEGDHKGVLEHFGEAMRLNPAVITTEPDIRVTLLKGHLAQRETAETLIAYNRLTQKEKKSIMRGDTMDSMAALFDVKPEHLEEYLKEQWIMRQEEEIEKPEYVAPAVNEMRSNWRGSLLSLELVLNREKEIRALKEAKGMPGVNEKKKAELDKKIAAAETRMGEHLMDRGSPKVAEEHFRKAIESDPDQAGAYVGLAKIALGKDDTEGFSRNITVAKNSEADINKEFGYGLKDKSGKALRGRIDELLEEKGDEEAMEYFDVLKDLPGNEAKESADKIVPAYGRKLDELIEKKPKKEDKKAVAEMYVNRAEAEKMSERESVKSNAAKSYKKALKYDKKSPEAQLGLGLEALRNKKYGKAMRRLKAASKDPSLKEEVNIARANIYLAKDKPDKAWTSISAVERDDEETREVKDRVRDRLVSSAKLHEFGADIRPSFSEKKKRLGRAISEIQRVSGYEPKNENRTKRLAQLMDKLADLYAAKGDNERALNILSQVEENVRDVVVRNKDFTKFAKNVMAKIDLLKPKEDFKKAEQAPDVTAKLPGEGVKRVVREDQEKDLKPPVPVNSDLVDEVLSRAEVDITSREVDVVVRVHPSRRDEKFFLTAGSGKEDVEAYSDYKYDVLTGKHTLTLHVKEKHYKDDLEGDTDIFKQTVAHEIAERVLKYSHRGAVVFEKKFASDAALAHNMSDRIKFTIDESADMGDVKYLKALLGEYSRGAHPEDKDGKFYDYVSAALFGITPKTAVIGIVGADQDLVNKLNGEYPDMEFISGTEDQLMTDLRGAQPAAVRQLVNIEGLREEDIPGIVEGAREEAFINAMKPYLGGRGVSGLGSTELKEALSIVKGALPSEKYTGMDEILASLYRNYVPRAITDEVAAAPEEEEEWVGVSMQALERFRSASKDTEKEAAAQEVFALYGKLTEHLRGKSQQEVDEVLTRHEEVATAREAEEGAMNLLAAVEEGKPAIGEKAIIVDARGRTGVEVNAMLPALTRFASLINIVIVTDTGKEVGVELPGKMVEIVADAKWPDMALGVRDSLAKSGIEVKEDSIVVITGAKDESTKWMSEHVGKNKEGSVNFIIADEDYIKTNEAGDIINRIIPTLAVYGLVRRYTDETNAPSVVAVGLSDKAAENFKDSLKDVWDFLKNSIKIVGRIDIGGEIRDFMLSVEKTAVSL